MTKALMNSDRSIAIRKVRIKFEEVNPFVTKYNDYYLNLSTSAKRKAETEYYDTFINPKTNAQTVCSF